MISRIHTVAFHGIKTLDIEVQVKIFNGVVGFNIVGLPDKAVAESRERIRSALSAMGLSLPAKRITVNLAPADVQKEGSHYDAAIAIALLAAMKVLPSDDYPDYLALGELSLDGRLLRVNGILPAAFHASSNNMNLICPAACGQEAAWVGNNLNILATPSLLDLAMHFREEQLLPNPTISKFSSGHNEAKPMLPRVDISDIKGQQVAKRALEIAAAGGHNLLMSGSPGAGKSMLASALPGLLPQLDPLSALEVSMIHSVAGMLPEDQLITQPQIRSPHHSASMPALIGGGNKARPGEISLAHFGVLFLDELPEFNPATLDAMRQPLETGNVTVARANNHVTYPARFQLIAAMNPCRCGYLLDAERACKRAPACGDQYQGRISGPLMDRFDLNITVPDVKIIELLSAAPAAESSEVVLARIVKARQIQQARYKEHTQTMKLNAHVDARLLKEVAPLSEKAEQILMKAAENLRLTARGYHRVIKVALTIADLENCEVINHSHISEALNYRHS